MKAVAAGAASNEPLGYYGTFNVMNLINATAGEAIKG
jgi:hypothetical protein